MMNAGLPLRLVAAATAMTALVLAGCLFGSFRAHALQDEASARSTELALLHGDILFHKERLTLSARMAAQTGDEAWLSLHATIEPMLAVAIERVIELADSEAVARAARETEAASAALAAIERQAFEQVRRGRLAAARALLDRADYQSETALYASGMRTLLDLTRRADSRRHASIQNMIGTLSAVAVFCFVSLAMIWGLVFRRLRSWRQRVEHERRHRREAEMALQSLNAQLERKVDERTVELERSEARLTRQANVDELTGLATRQRAVEVLKAQFDEASAQGEPVVVACIDIDGFREVNESLGHAEGDRLLVEVARRLRERFGAETRLARLGGDEFLVSRRLETPQELALTTESIESVFAEPFALGQNRSHVSVGTSVGVALYPEHGTEVMTLMCNADLAMYFAKRRAQGGVQGGTYHYDGALESARKRRREIEFGLREALEESQFRLHFQPKFRLGNERLCGAEALIRWTHPLLGEVFPDQFVPIAEESGLIVEMGEWVIEEAARQVAVWKREHGLDISVAVNVSPLQLSGEGLLATLDKALVANALRASALQVELTESSLVDNDAVTRRVLDGIAEMGCKLALDDFGTGYSSLSYLKTYPFDYLKIDRCFVSGMLENPQDAAVTRAIVALGRSLGLSTIAEGTETADQCAALNALGCEMAQGYHYSRPLPAEEFLRFATERAGVRRLRRAS